MSQGELYPVYAKRVIEPEVEIHKYSVFEHTHLGHQVYEIGHEIGLLGYFEKQKEAFEYWNHVCEANSTLPDKMKPDLVMIAEFKDQKSELDMEGISVRNSALLLKTAYPNFNVDEGKRVYKFDDWQDLNSFEIKQPILAKFNCQNHRLEFFNSKLAKVEATDKIDFMDLNFFSTKEIKVTPSLKQGLFNDNIRESLNDSQRQQSKITKGL